MKLFDDTVKRRILLIDDDEEDRLILADALAETGDGRIELRSATSVTEGLEVLAAERVDLILLDLSLPDSDGIESLQHMQAGAVNIPIVVLTGNDDKELAITAVQSGAQDYLVKADVNGPLLLRACLHAIERFHLLQDREQLRIHQLQASEARYRSLFEDSPMSLWEEDFSAVKRLVDQLRQDGISDFHAYFRDHPEAVREAASLARVVEVNKASVALLEVADRQQLIGPLSDIFRDHSYASFAEQLAAMADGQMTYQAEIMNQTFNGQTIYVSLKLSVAPECRHTWSTVLISLTDLTGRRKSEETIREQAALLDIAHDAVLVQDMDNRILYWNDAAEKLYGWTAEEILHQNFLDLSGQALSTTVGKAKEIVNNRQLWVGELQQTTRSGREIVVDSRWTLMYDEQQKPRSILMVNTDITEKRKMEQQLLRTQRMQSLGVLAGGIAHDLNNILAPIMLSIQLLKHRYPLTDDDKIIQRMETNSKRGADLVKQIFTFARGAEGFKQPVQIKHLIDDIKGLAADTFPKDIVILTNIADDLWMVNGDTTQIHQVLLNLCINARDAMPAGGTIRITAANTVIGEQSRTHYQAIEPGSYVAITVQDAGCGIEPNLLEHIFEPFFTTKKSGEGTGLGLATAMGIIKGHDGSIDVQSQPGEGSTFVVYLPSLTSAVLNGEKLVRAARNQGQNELVMVVDDEPNIQESVKEILQDNGYRVLVAGDGAEAVMNLSRHTGRIDLVITDMMMPVMNGPATIHAVKQLDPTAKIIAISGVRPDDAIWDTIKDQIDLILMKPFDYDDLLNAVRKVLPTTGEPDRSERMASPQPDGE